MLNRVERAYRNKTVIDVLGIHEFYDTSIVLDLESDNIMKLITTMPP